MDPSPPMPPPLEALAATLARLLAQYPGVRVPLLRLAAHAERQGDWRGRVTLGTDDSLAPATRHALQQLFPLAALRRTGAGQWQVDCTRLVHGLPAETGRYWRQALADVLGRPLRDRPHERAARAATWETLVARLALRYPAWPAVHAVLRAEAPRWQGRLEHDGEPALQTLLAQSLAVADYLSHNTAPIAPADLGAQVAGDSKLLRQSEVVALAARWLELNDTGAPGNPDAPLAAPAVAVETGAVHRLAAFGVCPNPTAITVTVFGPLVYEKHGQRHEWIERLWASGEAAVLTWANLTGITALTAPAGTTIYTCENESPFCRLVGAQHPGVIVYTAGFPNFAVKQFLRLLQPQTIRHWGDSDLAGLRIADQLHHLAPVRLWRCDADTLRHHHHRLRPLAPAAQADASRFLAAHPTFPFAAELAFTASHGWLEQEAWQADAPIRNNVLAH